MTILHIWRCQAMLALATLILSLGYSERALAQTPIRRLAVLEFQGLKLEADVLNTFSDAVRGGAAESLQANNTKVMTRENMMVLLREMGKSDCVEGDCEVETARSIGADFVVSGLVVHIENAYVVTLKLHETKDGGLLATDTVQAPTQLEMLDRLREHGQSLVAKRILPLPADEGKASLPKPAVEAPQSQPARTQPIAVAPPVVEKSDPAALAITESKPSPVNNPPGSVWRTVGVLTMIVGAGAVGGGVYFGLRAKSTSDELSSSKTFSASKDDDGKRAHTLQYVGYGVGGAAMAGGLVMVLLGRSESKLTLAPQLSSQYAGLSFQLPVR